MFKSNTVHLVGLVVLSFGLASCGRDQKPAAASSPGLAKVEARTLEQLPRIRRGSTSLDALAWDQEPDQTLKLTDSFETVANTDLSLRFRVACAGDKSLVQSTEFRNESRIDVFRILPKALLTSRLADKVTRCQITLNVDRVGSPVRGHTLTAQIVDGEIMPASIITPDRNAGELVVGNLYGVTARFENANPANAKIICGSIESAPVPFNVVQDLSVFDLRLTRQSSEVQSQLSHAPIQNCRLVITETNARSAPNATAPAPIAVSALFPLHFKGEAWRVKEIPVARIPLLPVKGAVIPIGEWEITNVGSQTTFIRFPSQLFRKVYVEYILTDGTRSMFDHQPWGRAVPYVENPPDTFADDALVEMPIGKTIHVKHEVTFPVSPTCAHRAVFLETQELLGFETYLDEQGQRGLGPVRLPWQFPTIATYDPTITSETKFHGSLTRCTYQ